ncbi:2-oxo-4-hydroxy-4-carboxy-5-ureidoimidazoline decarboxylase [Streptomyces sp. NWU49]|uniref:2-oxo-4-hydroxy-4-carboxy-5-ureidoimidazoline decarboxylase n=1 Tax=Streptomyces sp. NWU49 TaxID=2201153 RepID=UPI0035BF93BA
MPAHRLPDLPGRFVIPGQSRGRPGPPSPLEHFNAAPAEEARRTLLTCLDSPHWALLMAGHRPYPDLTSLLAASDEAAYDLTAAELARALTAEALPALPADTYAAAHTALNAAYAAYEAKFGHVFVICLDGLKPDAVLDHVLEGIRSRLANDPEEERPVAAEELRRLARGRLIALLSDGAADHRLSPPDEPDNQGECPRPSP